MGLCVTPIVTQKNTLSDLKLRLCIHTAVAFRG